MLMTETCKIINGITPQIMEKVFILWENRHNLRSFQEIYNENRKTVKDGIVKISSRTQFVSTILPNEYKLLGNFLHDSNLKIKKLALR